MAEADLIDAFQPSCRVCRNLKNKIYKMKVGYLPRVNSDTLRESAKRCRYCRLIYYSIATLFDQEFSQIEIHNWPTASKTLRLELGVLQEYSNRRLTKFSGSLPALSAIAERIQNLTGDTYCAGLWKSTLEDDLCWYNHSGSSIPSPEQRAPSWSWASIGANNFRLWPRLQSYDEEIIRVWIYGVDCTPAGLHKFGNVSYGPVLISGGLAQVELLVEEQELEPGSNDPSTPKYSIIWDSSLNVPKGRNQKEVPGSIFYPDVVPLTPAWAGINGNMKSTFCRRNMTNITQSNKKSDRSTIFCLLMKEYFSPHFIESKYDGDRLIGVFLVLAPSGIFEDSYERISFYVDQTSPVGWEKMRDLSLITREKITIV